jgi:hypothetical protein
MRITEKVTEITHQHMFDCVFCMHIVADEVGARATLPLKLCTKITDNVTDISIRLFMCFVCIILQMRSLRVLLSLSSSAGNNSHVTDDVTKSSSVSKRMLADCAVPVIEQSAKPLIDRMLHNVQAAPSWQICT